VSRPVHSPVPWCVPWCVLSYLCPATAPTWRNRFAICCPEGFPGPGSARINASPTLPTTPPMAG